MQSIGSKFKGVGDKMSRTGMSLTRGVTLPLIGIGVLAGKTAMDFEKSMNTMAAVAGVPAPELEKLGDLATELGAKTVFSANEAAMAMVELAKAGIKPADIAAGALANTLDLATAGDLELAEAAQVAANAMNTFNLEGKQSKQAVDALAGAANASSADVSGLAQALAQAGQTAFGAGLSIQETTAVLGLFAQKGLQGSDAGTSLKTMLLSLVPTSIKAKDAVRQLNLEFVDQAGNIRPITEIADELHTKLGDLTQAQQQVALKTIFGTDAFRAASIIMRSGSEGLKEYTKATNEQGTAAKVAEGKMKGLPGAIESLKGSAETFLLAVGDQMAPVVEDLAKEFTGLINKFQDLSPETQQMAIKFALVAAAAGPVLVVVGKLTKGMGYLIGGMTGVAKATKGVVGGINKLAGQQGLTGLAAVLSPGGIVIAGLALVAAGFIDAKLKAAQMEGAVKALTADLLAGGDAFNELTQRLEAHEGELGVAEIQTQLLAEAERRAKVATDRRIDSLLEGTGVERAWADAIKRSADMSLDQKSKLATLLGVQARYGIVLSDSEEFTLRFAIQTGNATLAIRLLERALNPALGALRNLLSYTQRNAEAMADWEQKTRRATAAIRDIPSGGGGGGGSGGSGGSGSGGTATGGPDSGQGKTESRPIRVTLEPRKFARALDNTVNGQ